MNKKSKRLLSALLSLAVILSLAGCGKKEEPPVEEGTYKAGTYTGVGKGRNGDITVEVVLSSEKIDSVTVTKHEETQGIADPAIEQIPAAIVEHQSLKVDAVAGATMTSDGILSAVTAALETAGVDVSTLMVDIEKGDTGEDRDVTVKLLVIGGGGTGLTAALSAMDSGMDPTQIMVVEKLAVLGGSAGMSGAVFQGPLTKVLQAKGGFEDYTEAKWLEDWKDWIQTYNDVVGVDSGYPNYDRVAKYISYLNPTMDWLEEKYDVCHWTYYRFMDDTNFVIPEEIVVDGVQSFVGGNVITDGMAKALTDKGAEIRMTTAGKKLLTDDAGKVIGAVVEDSKGQYNIYADDVVLATGGYSRNAELLGEFNPSYVNYIDVGTATAGDTGDGILMAREIGAAMYDNAAIISVGTAALNTAAKDYAGMMTIGPRMVVNDSGERFMNEAADYYTVSLKIDEQHGGTAWVLLGDALDNATDLGESTVVAPPIPGQSKPASVNDLKDAVDGENLVWGASIAELAAAMGVDPNALTAAVEAYNADAAAGLDSAYGKVMTPDMAIAGENFYAAKVGVAMAGTIGGVRTDADCRVLNENGQVIEGLWAGGCVSNRELLGHTYYHGAGFGYALVSGRIIGENVGK